jgi:hypothetical protein
METNTVSAKKYDAGLTFDLEVSSGRSVFVGFGGDSFETR